MSLLSSILWAVVASVLLLVLVRVSETPLPHNPLGVLLLFGAGLFISLGFLLFGHLRFDELLGEGASADRPCP